MSSSYGSGGRPFVDALFEVTASVGELFAAQDAPLRQFLQGAAVQAVKKQQLMFEIPSDLLSDYTVYHFDFTFWNVFGESGTTRLTVSKVPKAQIPPVFIIGPSKQPRNRPLTLTALIDLPKYGNILMYDFSWFVIKSPQALRLSKNKKPMLVVDPANLSMGRYVLGLSVTSSTGASMTFTHVVDIEPVPFSFAIYGGSRQISASDGTVIKVVSSQSDLSIKWTCTILEDGSPCVSRKDGALVEMEDGPETYFDSKILGSGEFEIEATGSDGFRTERDKIAITISPGDATLPKVFLLSEVDETNDIVIKAKLEDAKPLIEGATPQHSFRWESLSYCLGKYHAVLSNFGYLRKDLLNVTEHNVTISPSQLLPGASYCLKASAYSGDSGNTAFAYKIIKAKERDDNGFCRLDSSPIGTALVSNFIVSCHGFNSNNVHYRFKIKRRGEAIQLAPASSTPRIQRVVDLGHWEIFVDILDINNDGQVMRSISVRDVSTRMLKGGIERDEWLAKELVNFEASHNIDLGYSILAIALSSPTHFKHQATSPSLGHLLNLLDILSSNTPIDSYDTGPMLFKSLQKLLPPKIPLDLRPVTLRVLHRLIDEITSEDRPLPKELAISSLSILQPLFANPRGGSSASFTINAIFDHAEKALRPGMSLPYPHFNWTSEHLNLKKSNQTTDVCLIKGLELPINGTLNYRCIESDANHMRNYTTDTWLFSFNLFKDDKSLLPLLLHSPFNVTLKLSRPALLKVLKNRVIPKCSFYDRGTNTSTSWWSNDFCEEKGIDLVTGQLICECRWLMGDYAITLIPTKLSRVATFFKWAFLIIAAIALLASLIYWRTNLRKIIINLRERFKAKRPDTRGTGSTIGSVDSIISSASTVIYNGEPTEQEQPPETNS